MPTKLTVVVMGVGLFFAATAVSLQAHHSPSAEFQVDKLIELKGVLSKVEWFNPHIHVYLDVKEASGNVSTWSFEGNPPNWFRRAGVKKEDIAKAVGQNVTIEGSPARDGSKLGYFKKITFSDGTFLRFGEKETEK